MIDGFQKPSIIVVKAGRWLADRESMIRFNFDNDKFFAIMRILSSKTQGLDILKAVKLIYFIDREHLRKYGRPVLGDHYFHLPFGPVPTQAYDILKTVNSIKANNGLVLDNTVLSPRGYATFKCLNDHDEDIFSEAEKKTIDNIVELYGSLDGRQLSDRSHDHKTWTATIANQPIAFELFFEEEPDECRDALEIMILEQEDRDFIDGI